MTLGGVRVLMNGQDITSELPIKIIAILIYMARHGQPKSREYLAELFWGDRPAKQAYGNLRTAISKSKVLLDDALIVGHQEIKVDAWLDANEFEELSQNPLTIQKALEVYLGDFIPSFFIGDAREFEDWQLHEAEKLQERFIQTTLQAIQQLQIQSRPQDAILTARRAIGLYPLREDIQRALIQLYQTSGDRVSALRQYHAYRSLIWEELGVEPDAETQAIFHQLEKTPVVARKIDYPLPSRMTSFIGRLDDIYQVESLLQTNPLVTITATGGAGKTRLALEIAYRLQNVFPDGVCFVDLSEIEHHEHITPTLARYFRLSDDPNPLTQVTNYLQNRKMLIILDNFEHVMDGTDIIAHWMKHAPQITFLITSREPLKLYGEVIFHLQMLSAQESCQLFYERIRAIHHDFHRTEALDMKVKTICQRLDGLPLAIELAATRARTMSIDEILDGLNHCFDLLASDLRDMPRRQRTLFSTMDWSYSLLTPEQARLFRQLAVFRGGWRRDTIQFLSSNTKELDSLVEKNLVRRVFSGTHRYAMLETIREYAYYQLEKNNELIIAQNAQVQWILHLSEDAMHRLRTSDHVTSITQIKEEEENIRVVLDYLATQPRQIESYARILSACGWIWNFLQIANIPFHHAKQIIPNIAHLPPALRAHVLVAGGHSAHTLGYYELAEEWQQKGLAIFDSLGDTTNANYTRFFMSGRLTDEQKGSEQLIQIRQYALSTNDTFLLSLVDINLGTTLLHKGKVEQSLVIFEEGLAIAEANGYWIIISVYYLDLADAYYAHGEIEKAFKYLERAYAISQTDDTPFTSAVCLMDLCELCYAVGRIGDIYAHLRDAEPFIKQVNSPTLTVRFQFWKAVMASLNENMPQFYVAYTYILPHLHTLNTNMSFYIINAILYLTLVMVKQGKYLEECALLLGGAEAYRNLLNIAYSAIQEKWRDQILQAFDKTIYPQQEQGKLLAITDIIKNAQTLLETLVT